MRKLIAFTFAAVTLAAATSAFARDPIKDGKLMITPGQGRPFRGGGIHAGQGRDVRLRERPEGNQEDHRHRDHEGRQSTDMQKHIIAITAKALQVDAFIDLDGKTQTLVDPTPSPDTTPPPIENSGAGHVALMSHIVAPR